jgi:hypothetical protein
LVIFIVIGLALEFIGALGLTYEFGFSRVVYSPLYYTNEGPKYMPLKRKNGTYERIRTTKDEVIITSSFVLLCIGFLLQTIGTIFA